jgi:hypothetical protein
MRVLFEFSSRNQGHVSGDNRDERLRAFQTNLGSLKKLIVMSEERQQLAATLLRPMAAFV